MKVFAVTANGKAVREMTLEETVEYFRDMSEGCAELRPRFQDDMEMTKLALSALEKQIPKKPIDICTPVVTWGLCPECKGELNELGSRPNRVFESNHYCPDCGQALDWGDTE